MRKELHSINIKITQKASKTSFTAFTLKLLSDAVKYTAHHNDNAVLFNE
jgi:hypothetical protein